MGGGIQNRGTFTLTDSTISANTGNAAGGGIQNEGTTHIVNSTISGNTLSSTGHGGGIYSCGPLTISQGTILNNQAGSGGALYMAGGNGESQLLNTIIAQGVTGTGGTCSTRSGGKVTSLGFNLESKNNCNFSPENGDLINTEPVLGSLQDNGGFTRTHALQPNSPAIDAGSCRDINDNPVNVDQRGISRPQPPGGACDIGAYEARNFSLVIRGGGTNDGTITNTGIHCDISSGICSGDCSENFLENTVVSLAATPGGDSTFAGWSGDCSGSTVSTTLTMDGNKTCTASFVGVSKGDVNSDGVINVFDSRLVLQYTLGLITLTDNQKQAADVAPPCGTIDINDAILIAQVAIGMKDVSAFNC